MALLDQLSFSLGRRLPLILQTEAAECGLASLAMIAGYHGFRTDLQSMRRRFLVSSKGTTLAQLMQLAQRMDLTTRPVKLDLEALSQLRLPCILHWNFNHFVVLKEVSSRQVTVHDPAQGQRKLSWDEVSEAFTGVALEVWPSSNFKPAVDTQRIRLRELIGRVSGLKRSFGQIIMLALALEVFTLTAPFFMQWVIDNVIVTADYDLLLTLALGFGLLMLMQQAIWLLRAWVLMFTSTTLNVQWRANVFTHLLQLPVEYFEKRHIGDVVSRFGSIETIQRTLTGSFLEAILDGVMTSLVLAVMFFYSPKLALVALTAMLLYALGRWAWYQPLRNATEEQIIRAAKQQSHFLETVRGVKAIKLFQRQEERRTAWLALLVDQINADLTTQKLHIFYATMNKVLFGAQRIVVIYFGALLILEGQFTVGMLVAFIAYKDQFDRRVSTLIDRLVEIKMLRLQGERLADIVLSETEQQHDPVLGFDEQAELEPTIEVKGLRYRYADQEPWVLDGIDLKIEPGESIAIIGPSGCGKSTLVSTLLGIRQPTEGEVRVGGVPTSQIGTAALRDMVGTVMQDDNLLAGSIAENISFFDTSPDQARIEQCAQFAAVHDEIVAMPMAYNTLIGDMGAAISGGQKQRILLARALYKKPKILFLDEATSHLDVARERQVNANVRALSVTRILIAHRPETIASADRVVQLGGGKVVADQRRPQGEQPA